MFKLYGQQRKIKDFMPPEWMTAHYDGSNVNVLLFFEPPAKTKDDVINIYFLYLLHEIEMIVALTSRTTNIRYMTKQGLNRSPLQRCERIFQMFTRQKSLPKRVCRSVIFVWLLGPIVTLIFDQVCAKEN